MALDVHQATTVVSGQERSRRVIARAILPTRHGLTGRSSFTYTHRSFGSTGKQGIRDENLLESALDRPRKRWECDDTVDLAGLAAACGFGLARNHAFLDGNKRIALMVMYVFLAIDGRELEAPETESVNLMTGTADGTIKEEVLAAWVRDHLIKHRAWPSVVDPRDRLLCAGTQIAHKRNTGSRTSEADHKGDARGSAAYPSPGVFRPAVASAHQRALRELWVGGRAPVFESGQVPGPGRRHAV